MSAIPLELSDTYEIYYCCHGHCRVPIVLPTAVVRSLRNTHDEFHCFNGHPQSFQGKSEAEKLREQLEAERSRSEFARKRADAAERRASAARGQVTRIKNRVGNGVCPCCNRTFQNLMRHMKTKHPGYSSETE